MKLRDNDRWVATQFGECELGDKRRTKRLLKVAENMLVSPEKSLPQQSAKWSDLKAAYRLFDKETVTFQAIAQPHWQQTRNTKPGRYLLISDTTEIDHTTHESTTGLSQIGNGGGRGMQLHNCLVYNTNEKLIEGVAGALLHYRIKVPKKETRTQRLNRIRESDLWGNIVEKVGAAPGGCQWIHVFDRGGDNFEAMCKIELTGCDWIIRAARLNRKIFTADRERKSVKDALKEDAEVLGSYELNLPTRRGVKARTAKLTVSTVGVTLPHPRLCSKWVKQCGVKELATNIVVVEELNRQKGVTPIKWVLYTSLPVRTLDDAWQIIEDYENRWLVEEYHKCLKTGCSIETHALRTSERLEALMGLVSVVGVRLIQMKLIGRSQKKAKAATHVPSSWLKCLKLAKPKVRLTDLTVYEFFRELAKLGGFLARKGDGEPGWQTIWRGYEKLQSLLDGIRLVTSI